MEGSIELTKIRLADLQTEIGGMLDYEAGQIDAEYWWDLATYTKELASLLSSFTSRMAGYAGYCQRMANEE